MSLKRKLIFLIRQFPFIWPATIIDSCEVWLAKQAVRRGVYQSQRGPWYREIFPASFIRNPKPQTCGKPNEKAFANNRSYPVAASGLFFLQNCYLFGHKGIVMNHRNQVFQEFSHHFGIWTLKKFLRKHPFYLFTASVADAGGIGAVLVSPESHNYYHWLNDVLPRIRLYEEVIEQVDFFCISSAVPVKFLEALSFFGIDATKIRRVSENEKLHFDHLFVASLPGSEGRSPQWASDYVRKKLIPADEGYFPGRKLYFRRGTAAGRCILNEEDLIRELESRGFEAVDPGTLSIPQQVDLMQQTTVVAGAHGAAFSNLLFARAGTMVIELFSPDYFRTDCYYTLSAMLNLNYWYIAGDKPPKAHWGEVRINPADIIRTLEAEGHHLNPAS